MRKPSAARERLLAVAGEIFYREGIHAVGVDRLVGEADVTRATFYRHFPSKDDLVRAYIEREDAALRDLFASAATGVDDPEQVLQLVLGGVALDVQQHHTRGCPFINASAEFPDPTHPVRAAVRAHREWFATTLAALVEGAGRPPARAAELVLLRDAALVGAYLDGPDVAVPAFLAAGRALLGLPELD